MNFSLQLRNAVHEIKSLRDIGYLYSPEFKKKVSNKLPECMLWGYAKYVILVDSNVYLQQTSGLMNVIIFGRIWNVIIAVMIIQYSNVVILPQNPRMSIIRKQLNRVFASSARNRIIQGKTVQATYLALIVGGSIVSRYTSPTMIAGTNCRGETAADLRTLPRGSWWTQTFRKPPPVNPRQIRLTIWNRDI